MKTLLKSLFLVLALTILGYSAFEADAQSLITEQVAARTCCTYQVDCAENQTCEWIHPYCSQDKHYICKDKKVIETDVTPVGD